jgi:hypothetical protein
MAGKKRVSAAIINKYEYNKKQQLNFLIDPFKANKRFVFFPFKNEEGNHTWWLGSHVFRYGIPSVQNLLSPLCNKQFEQCNL